MKLRLTLDFDRNCLSEIWNFRGVICVPVLTDTQEETITLTSNKYAIEQILECNSSERRLTLNEGHAEIISEAVRDLLETAMLGVTVTDSDETYPPNLAFKPYK